MAVSLSAAFVTLFEAEVKQAYQATSQLMGTMRTRTGVEGSTAKFPKLGRGVAQLRIPQTDVTPMNLQWTQATATLQDWTAPEYSDIFNQQKVNFEERRELVMAVSAAIGRRLDQLVIDALDVPTYTSQTVDEDIGGTSTNLNVTKMRETKRIQDALNVPPSDRHIVVHANNLAAFLGETEATSADFNSVKALVQGDIDTFMGYKFHVLGDRAEGGLPKATNDRTGWAWHKAALGLAIGLGPKVEINYIPEKTSWLVNAMLAAGSVVIDTEGVVEITYDESDLG